MRAQARISAVLAAREPLALALRVPLVGSGLGLLGASHGQRPEQRGPQERRVRRYGDHVEARFGVPPRPIARRAVYPRGDAVLVAGLPYPLYGLDVLRFRHLQGGREPEGEREVRGPDVDAVDAGRRGDLVHPFEGLPGLDHDEAEDLAAEVLGVARS